MHFEETDAVWTRQLTSTVDTVRHFSGFSECPKKTGQHFFTSVPSESDTVRAIYAVVYQTMRITSVTTAGSSGFPYNVVTMLGALLLLWSPTIVAAAAEMLTFPLTRTNATSVVNQYAIEMQLGTIGYARSVYFLPILYSSAYYSEKNGGPKPLYVPSAELCLAQGVWNEFLSPEHGEFVNTISPYVVEWDASVKTKEVNLSLMKGGGAEGKNITVIGSTSPFRFII